MAPRESALYLSCGYTQEYQAANMLFARADDEADVSRTYSTARPNQSGFLAHRVGGYAREIILQASDVR